MSGELSPASPDAVARDLAAGEARAARPVPTTAETVRSPRRVDIEGLRIVAVALVVVYHFSQAGVSGGVDVFLFLSGYFVLGGLARRLARREPPRLRDFYQRTARRLVPMAWLTATTTVVAAHLVSERGGVARLVEQFWAGLLYVENIWLARHQVAYGSASTYLDPFQHLWSLSVQLQVFVVAPLILVAGSWIVTRRGRAPQNLVVLVAVLAGASATVSWWMVSRDQADAYFSSPARAWEFIAGALLALLVPRLRLPSAVRSVLGWLGLALLAATGLLIDGAQEFPGPWALVPLLAAAAIIVAGTRPTRFGVDRLLSRRMIAGGGRYAYGLYLWHWPVMSVWLLASGNPRLGPRGLLLVLTVTVLLTVVSHHLIEGRFRAPRREWSFRSRWLAGSLTACVLATVAGTVVTYREDRRWTAEVTALAAVADLSTHPGAMSVYRPDLYPAPDDMLAIPVPQSGAVDSEAVEASCDVVGHEPGMWCLWDLETGDGDAAGADVVLLGGSHSGAWLQPTQLVGETLDWNVSAFIRGGCPFVLSDVLDVADYYDPDWTDGCNAWNAKLMDHLIADPPDLVVTTFSRPFGPQGEPEWVPPEYVEMWSALGDIGTDVLAIRANAQLPSSDRVCSGADRCSFPRGEIYGDDATILGTAVPDNVHLLDLTQYACESGVCPSVIGNVRVYADQTHLTNSYGLSAWPIVYDYVVAAFPELGR